MSEAETIQFSPRNRAGAPTNTAHAHSNHPATTCFTRLELNEILNLYGRKVAAGELGKKSGMGFFGWPR